MSTGNKQWYENRPYICDSCNGSGQIGEKQIIEICDYCNGSGILGSMQCYECNGRGKFKYTVKIPCSACGGNRTVWK